MRVGMQPGDNYRIAATVFPTNNLNTLQTSNVTANGYVPAYTDEVKGGFNGALSPLLTVWRKLHLEIDSMTAVATNGPEANFLSAKVLVLKTNYPNPGQTAVYFRASSYPMQTNRYENGTLTIPGIANYQVIVGQGADYNWQFNNYLNYVVVSGTIPSSAIGATAQLRDDDDRFLSIVGLPPALPKDEDSTNIVQGIRGVFFRAYIDVTNANGMGLNSTKQIAFKRNQSPGLAGGPFTDAKNVFDSALFWAHTAVMAYQPSEGRDKDPNLETADFGLTRKQSIVSDPGVSAIYMEVIRDANDELFVRYANQPGIYPTLIDGYYKYIYGVTAHEIGHYPGRQSEGNDHAEDGLMNAEAQQIVPFTAPSIKRFRKATRWSD